MTTTRQKLLMLAAILGLATWCGWEAMGLHLWNTVAFGFLAVSCAVMFAVQVGEERGVARATATWSGRRIPLAVRPEDNFIPWRRVLLDSIRSSRNWTWRVKR